MDVNRQEQERIVTPASVDNPPGRVARVLMAAPAIAFLATFGAFFVHKNPAARSVFGSGRGLLAVAVIVAGYAALALVLRRLVRWAWVAPVVLTGVVLGLAAWIVLPYYVDETGNRRLVSGPVTEAGRPPAALANPDQGAAPTTPTTEAPPTATRISSGPIKGLGHEASGTASLIRNPDGSLIVRFEDFDIEGVPDPRVHLVRGGDVRRAGGVDLGRLPANRGQVLDLAVPGTSDAGGGWTVLVWCRAFAVPVANATQTAR